MTGCRFCAIMAGSAPASVVLDYVDGGRRAAVGSHQPPVVVVDSFAQRIGQIR